MEFSLKFITKVLHPENSKSYEIMNLDLDIYDKSQFFPIQINC